jgi:hypothetical protein
MGLRVSPVLVVALMVSAALAGRALLAPPPAQARASSALYYETETRTGQLGIDKLDLSGPESSTQVVEVGNVSLFGIAVAGPYIYWSFESGVHDHGAIMRATLNGQDVRQLVGGLDSPESLIATHGYLYWNAQNAIGRVALDGSHLRRRFIVLPQELGGGVADGLASDGRHLFFSRCPEHTVGRADLNGTHVASGFMFIGATACPEGLAAAGRHLYWTELGAGRIGRANVDGHGVDARWLNIRSDQGPFQIVADSAHVYWSWGGVAGGPSYTGRADADGSGLDRRFLTDSLYPMALAGGGPG